MKTKLLIIIFMALILVACVDGADDKTEIEIKEPVTLQETGIHRYIDTELNIACYTFSRTNVSFMMSCVSIDKAEELDKYDKEN